jgi:hypothetical protein
MNTGRLARIRLRDFQFERRDRNAPGLNQAALDRRFLLEALDAVERELREMRRVVGADERLAAE